MKPIATMSNAEAAYIRYVLMDIDDTLTTEGKLSAAAYSALWDLHDAGLKVIPITGRPAGWCDLIAREWPVDGVVGENGALVFWLEDGKGTQRKVSKQEFHPNAVHNDHPVLKRIKKRAMMEVPGIRMAKDQFARLFDIALDFAEEEPVLSLETAEKVRAIAAEEGAVAKISSIHVNVWMGNYNKLSMTELFLQKKFNWTKNDDNTVIFVGDSPNDEPMFARFPMSCGVVNVKHYGELIQHLPAFVSQKESGEGFAEITETLLKKRQG
ncbi:MAG: HAD-IIB family hydrolase [Treponema sp.]|nr:HAD-IIB family hydrolase [Treponema sp.]